MPLETRNKTISKIFRALTFTFVLVGLYLSFSISLFPAKTNAQTAEEFRELFTATWVRGGVLRIDTKDGAELNGIPIKYFEGEYKYTTPCGSYSATIRDCVNSEDGKEIYQKPVSGGGQTCPDHNQIRYDGPFSYGIGQGTNRILAEGFGADSITLKFRFYNDATGECVTFYDNSTLRVTASTDPNEGVDVYGEWIASNAIKIYRDNKNYIQTGSDANIFIAQGDDDNCPDLLKLTGSTDNNGNSLANYYDLKDDGDGNEVRPDCGEDFAKTNAKIVKTENKDKPAISDGGGDEPDTCESVSDSPLGWMICPVLETTQGVLEWFIKEGPISNLLRFDVGDSQELEQVWSGFRLIANIIFVIAFFVVIYSAATGNFMSSYDVRKLLPRLFIVAILVQLSFFLSKEALAITNEIGDGVQQIMLFPVQDSSAIRIGDVIPANNIPVLDQAAWIADAAIGTIAGIVFAIVMLILAVYAVIGLIMLGVVFIVRDMGIVILIAVSPIAFALNVLPGTDGYFKKWWKWYFGLLSMYPIMMAFISSGQLVAAIWSASVPAGMFNTIITTVVVFLPFLFATKILRFAGQASGALTGVFKSVSDKYSKTKGRFKDSAAYKNTVAQGKAKAWNKYGSGINTRIAGKETSKFKGLRRGIANSGALTGARITQASQKVEDEQMAASEILYDAQIAKIRADAVAGKVMKTDRKGNVIGGPVGADDAAVQFLDKILHDTHASEGQRRAAGKKLSALYGTNTNAVASLREAIDLRATGSTEADQAFGNKVLSDNYSGVGKDMPHVYKGVGAKGVDGALSMDTGAVLGFKKSSLEDMLSDSAHATTIDPATKKPKTQSPAERIASQQAALRKMKQKYIEAAKNENLRGSIVEGNAKFIMSKLSGTELTEFQQHFNPDGSVII